MGASRNGGSGVQSIAKPLLTAAGLPWAVLLLSYVSTSSAQTSLPSGTYNFKDASGNTWDGGFNRHTPSNPHMYLYSYNNGPDQQFIWNGSTLQEVADGEHVYNGSGSLEVGSPSSTFAIVTSGSGYTIKDVASGLYVSSPNAQYPTTMSLSSSATVWTAINVGGGSTTKIDDADASIVYSLGIHPPACSGSNNWCHFTGGSEDYNSDEHSSQLGRSSGSGSNFQGPSVAITFNGTGISWIGKKGPNYGTALWSLDGNTSKDGSHSGIFNGFNSTELDQNVNLSLSTSPGYHVLSLGLQSATNGSERWQTIDAFQITGSPVPLSSGTKIGYSTTPSLQSITHGSWTCGADSQTDLSGGHCWSWTTGDYMQWSFTGTLIEVYGRPDSEDGYMDVSIDGQPATRVDLGVGTVDDDPFNGMLIFAKSLSAGSHTIKISVVGANDGFAPISSNCGGQNHCVQIDQLVAF